MGTLKKNPKSRKNRENRVFGSKNRSKNGQKTGSKKGAKNGPKNVLKIGSKNASFCHIKNTQKSLYFSKKLHKLRKNAKIYKKR